MRWTKRGFLVGIVLFFILGIWGNITSLKASSLPLDSLMVYLSFDDPDNPVTDETGNLASFVVNGDLFSVPGIKNNGLLFPLDGRSYFYSYNDFRWPTTSFTIAGWAKPYTLDTDGIGWLGFVTKDEAFNLEFKNGRGHTRLRKPDGYYWYDQYFTPEAMVENNVFHFVTVTFDGQTLTFYKDSLQVGQITLDFSTDLSKISPLTVGLDKFGSQNYFEGVMDELTLWSVALSEEEIKTLYLSKGDPYASPVPLPESLYLLLSGLGCVVWGCKRFAKS